MTRLPRVVRWMTLTLAAALALGERAARAQEEWKEEGGEGLPPDDHRKKEDKQDAGPETPPTRFLVDLKIGPVFLLAARSAVKGATEFGLQINAGYALSHDMITKGDALYLTLSPYLIVGQDLTLVAPLGVQYDLPLSMIAYKGLYAYARASVGYAFYQPPLARIDSGIHSLAVQPALGARVTFFDRFHVGIEPFGLDIVHTFPPKGTTNVEDTIVAFQLAIFGGARF